MKKVLVAGAALMLAGSMISAASAGTREEVPEEQTGISITGDARVTYAGQMDYARNAENDSPNGYSDFFESRVGLNLDAKAKGGTYVKTRMYFDDKGWDDDAVWDGYKTMSVTTDYAYFGVPLGGNWSVKAGLVPVNTTTFFSWGKR
ncbi:MAG: hypothetical protein D3924_17600, partial [Candidatus Electrothrix sp. AR4]|nr:hypothetical protein [Candidatus Electrothrix sp. AR4]